MLLNADDIKCNILILYEKSRGLVYVDVFFSPLPDSVQGNKNREIQKNVGL